MDRPFTHPNTPPGGGCDGEYPDTIMPVLYAILCDEECFYTLIPLVEPDVLETFTTREMYRNWLLRVQSGMVWENYLHLLYYFGVFRELIVPVK